MLNYLQATANISIQLFLAFVLTKKWLDNNFKLKRQTQDSNLQLKQQHGGMIVPAFV